LATKKCQGEKEPLVMDARLLIQNRLKLNTSHATFSYRFKLFGVVIFFLVDGALAIEIEPIIGPKSYPNPIAK